MLLIDDVLLLAACTGLFALLLFLYLRLRRRHARAMAELAATEEALRGARSRELALRHADAAKDQFIAMLGHELRTPLNALLAAAHMLEHAKAGEELTREAGGVVGRQARQMTRLVEDLLDVNRIVRGKVSLSRRPLDVARVVEEVLGELRMAGRLAKHDVRLALQPAWVRADEARLKELESCGLVERHVATGPPIKVTYELTTKGLGFHEVAASLQHWGRSLKR